MHKVESEEEYEFRVFDNFKKESLRKIKETVNKLWVDLEKRLKVNKFD